MPDDFEKNFIPRKRVDPSQAGLRVQTTVDTLTAVGLLMFALVFFVALSLFGAGLYVKSDITKLNAEVVGLASNFTNTSEIEEIAKLDSKVTKVAGIIKNHTSISKVFAFLETSTVSSVVISNVSVNEGGKSGPTVSISGEAQSYNALAFQSSIYKKNTDISSVTFTGITPNEGGRISFNAELALRPGVFQFPR